MCLTKVDAKPVIEEGIGYKILHRNDSGYLRTYRDWEGYTPVPLKMGEWVFDPNQGDYIEGRYHFKAGFHIFLNLEDAWRWGRYISWILRVYKIAFREVVQTGTQMGYPIVVAREIKVLEQVN